MPNILELLCTKWKIINHIVSEKIKSNLLASPKTLLDTERHSQTGKYVFKLSTDNWVTSRLVNGARTSVSIGYKSKQAFFILMIRVNTNDLRVLLLLEILDIMSMKVGDINKWMGRFYKMESSSINVCNLFQFFDVFLTMKYPSGCQNPDFLTLSVMRRNNALWSGWKCKAVFLDAPKYSV